MQDFLQELAAKLQSAAAAPNVLTYKPNSPQHEAFHKSQKVGRLLRGGNRSGKSVAGAVEGIIRSIGRHPYIKTHETPTRGRIVTVDIDSGIKEIIAPLLKQWTPPSELVNGSWEDSFSLSKKEMKFRNGSTHQQDVDSFAGVPRHWTWFDEECPQAIFNECRLRLVDYNGVWWMTMTPVEGQDWIFDRFIVSDNKNVEMFEVDITDNPHLSKEALALLEEDLDEDEKAVRQHGTFIPKGGLILREFDYSRHVIEPSNLIPKSWTIYCSIDHGLNNPTAVLWHALSPHGEVVTFKEHYMRRWVISKHVNRIKEINAEIGREPILYMGDPSMAQKEGITGSSPLDEYRRLGIPLMQAKRDVKGRINKMNEYLKYDMWKITTECPNTIKEARKYSFKIFTSPKIADRNNVREEPNKKDDHAMDSAGYFFTFMPYLQPQLKKPTKIRSLTETNMEDFPWQVDNNLMGGLDDDGLAFGEIR